MVFKKKVQGGKKKTLDDYGASRNLHRHAESAAKIKVESSLKRASGEKVKLGNKKKRLNDVANDDIIDLPELHIHLYKSIFPYVPKFPFPLSAHARDLNRVL